MLCLAARREANLARYATLAGGTVLASTSGYLLFILATKFPGDSCTWCLASATLSAAVFGSALRGFSARSAAPQLRSRLHAPAKKPLPPHYWAAQHDRQRASYCAGDGRRA